MVDENGDGIFEPGSLVFIDGLEVTNPGGLPLPDGASARPVCTEFSVVEVGTPLPVPALPIGAWLRSLRCACPALAPHTC